jgi:HEAT repeat protein
LRVTAAAALAKLFPNDKAIEKQSVDVMLAGLTSKDQNVRRAAVQAMAESKASSDLTQPKLVEMIKGADPQLIGDIIRMLTSLGADAVPRVKRGLANPDLRGYAAVILGNIGPAAKDAVPELVKALDVADDPTFRREVLYTLGRIGPASAPAAAKIVDILKTDKNERVLSSACYAAGSIGPPATDAAPALVGLYNDGTDFQKMLAIWALLKIRPGHDSIVKRAVPLMTKGLSHERDDVRIEAAHALGNIGAPAASALPELRKLLDNPNDAVRKAAQEAMAKIQK